MKALKTARIAWTALLAVVSTSLPLMGATNGVNAAEDLVRIKFTDVALKVGPGVKGEPGKDFGLSAEDGAARFFVMGKDSAHWVASLPQAADYQRLPYVSVRYKAVGDLGKTAFIIFINGSGEKQWTYPLRPGNIIADGQWHLNVFKVDAAWEAKNITVLLSAGPGRVEEMCPDYINPAQQSTVAGRVDLWLDYISFSAARPKLPLAEVLPLAARPAAPGGPFCPLPLPAPEKPGDEFWKRLDISGWFPDRHVFCRDIPFDVPATPAAIPVTGMEKNKPVEISLPAGTREVLLLLAAALPESEVWPVEGQRACNRIREPERFAVEIRYAEGPGDLVFPVRTVTGQYDILRGLDVYAVHPQAGRQAASLVLHDKMSEAAFGLVGATANPGKPVCSPPAMSWPWYPAVKKAKPIAARLPEIRVKQDSVELTDGIIGARFGTSAGLVLTGLQTGYKNGSRIGVAESAIFNVRVEDRDIRPDQWRVSKVQELENGAQFSLDYKQQGLDLSARLTVTLPRAGELAMNWSIRNTGDKAVRIKPFLGSLSGLQIGNAADTWYWTPRLGGGYHHIPCQFRDVWAYRHPLQVDGFFNPNFGWGLALMTHDREGIHHYYHLGKDTTGGNYQVEYVDSELAPGQDRVFPESAIIAVRGDWHEQLAAYKDWLATWFRPMVPRNKQLLHSFAWVSFTPSYLWHQKPYEPEKNGYHAIISHFKALPCDFIHDFSWAWRSYLPNSDYGWGDYDAYKRVPGLQEQFREDIARAQEAGMPIELYLDPWMLHHTAKAAAGGVPEKWGIRYPNGKLYDYPMPGTNQATRMCLATPYQDHIVEVYSRVARETGSQGLYLDEFGYFHDVFYCYSAAHGHPAPEPMFEHELRTTRRIRDSISPAITMRCEAFPPDVVCQYMDGAYDLSIELGEQYDAWSPHRICLARFALPHFKLFTITHVQPLKDGNWWMLKLGFFNGNGLAYCQHWAADEAIRDFLRRSFGLQKQYADAFMSADVTPLAQTEVPGLFANRFSSGKETIWTFFNANFRTVRGGLIKVAHLTDATYTDAWNKRPIGATVKDNTALLEFEIEPRDIGCIVQTRN